MVVGCKFLQAPKVIRLRTKFQSLNVQHLDTFKLPKRSKVLTYHLDRYGVTVRLRRVDFVLVGEDRPNSCSLPVRNEHTVSSLIRERL